jgi:hypothetical protein
VTNGPHGLGEHVHFLEVDQPVEASFVSFVGECHVFEEEGHERHHGRSHFANGHAVRPVVAARVDQTLKLGERFPRLGRHLVPRLGQPADGHVGQSHHDRAKGVQVLVLFAAEFQNFSFYKFNIVVILHSLSCELDEFAHQLHPSTDGGRQTKL